MNTEIKPCPFCGLNHCVIDGVYGKHFVQCENTLCNYVSGFRVTESQAIEAHNQLSALREKNAQLKISITDRTDGLHCIGYIEVFEGDKVLIRISETKAFYFPAAWLSKPKIGQYIEFRQIPRPKGE